VIAIIMTLYVAGVTWFARREADAKPSTSLLLFGSTVMVAALATLASLPWWLNQWIPEAQENSMFGLLVAMSGVLLGRRLLTAIGDPRPETIQLGVKQSLLSLILLDAYLAYWWSGSFWGAGIALLIVPAIWLGGKFRTT
jgi:4-hydroxybenzoate polyprenyltransferase